MVAPTCSPRPTGCVRADPGFILRGSTPQQTRTFARTLAGEEVQTSPFGLKERIPVYAEASIFELERIFINGGHRGLLVALAPSAIEELLSPERVEVAG